jgi:hypothetical protein
LTTTAHTANDDLTQVRTMSRDITRVARALGTTSKSLRTAESVAQVARTTEGVKSPLQLLSMVFGVNSVALGTTSVIGTASGG